MMQLDAMLHAFVSPILCFTLDHVTPAIADLRCTSQQLAAWQHMNLTQTFACENGEPLLISFSAQSF